MRTVNIGLCGLGTVGGGTVRIINRHHDDFLRHAGVDLRIARVCSRHDGMAKELGLYNIWTSDYRDIVNDPDIDIVVELIGGTETAKSVVIDSLNAGKNVVTANKALMASCGHDIFEAADAHDVEVAFEASVGGGIPIIEPLKHSLVSNEITSVLGIVNGTTNYMLTLMDEEGMSYEAALKKAQENGFAEANPTADVDGYDAAAKIAILASIAFNSRVTIDDVPTSGIRSIAPVDLEIAHQMGYVIKLLAAAHRTEGGIETYVQPAMLPLTHQLAHVKGVMNAIYVTGDAVGDTMFYGPGAGSGPAASAVVGDIIEVARRVSSGTKALVGCTCTDHLPMVKAEDTEARFYIRMRVQDKPGSLAATADAFGSCNVSIATMVQRTSDVDMAEIAYTTHASRVKDVSDAIGVIKTLKQVEDVCTVIRVED